MSEDLFDFSDLMDMISQDVNLSEGEDFDFEVNKNILKIIPKTELKYNHDYVIKIDQIRNKDGDMLKIDKTVKFSTQLLPYHSSVTKVREILEDLSMFFSKREVAISIRDASQKAYRYQSLMADPNNPSFEVMDEEDENFFPVTKYISYFAAYLLIMKLMSKLIGGDLPDKYETDDEGNEIKVPSGGYEFRLGDFQVKPSSSTESESDPKKKAEAFQVVFDKAKEMSQFLKIEWKYWLDESMNRTKRGYTQVTSGEIKSGSYRPEDRDF